MPRALLDPNVLISGLIWRDGPPARLLLALRMGAFELVVSERVVTEIREVLRRPKLRRYVSEEDIEDFVADLRRSAVVVADPDRVESVCRDPKDDYLVALARLASVHFLVTGDADLLEIGLRDVKIVSPRVFLGLLPG